MKLDFETDLMSALAVDLCDELYEVAKRDPKIMVNNWCAFAVLALFREISLLLGGTRIPSIDECLAGKNEPAVLTLNPKWEQLKAWHNYHWELSQSPAMWEVYYPYISKQSLIIGRYVLTP